MGIKSKVASFFTSTAAKSADDVAAKSGGFLSRTKSFLVDNEPLKLGPISYSRNELLVDAALLVATGGVGTVARFVGWNAVKGAARVAGTSIPEVMGFATKSIKSVDSGSILAKATKENLVNHKAAIEAGKAVVTSENTIKKGLATTGVMAATTYAGDLAFNGGDLTAATLRGGVSVGDYLGDKLAVAGQSALSASDRGLGTNFATSGQTTEPGNGSSFASGVGGATGFQMVDVPTPQEQPLADAPPQDTQRKDKRAKQNDSTSFDFMHLLRTAGNNPLPILSSGLGFMMGGPVGAMIMGVIGYMLNKTEIGGAINNWISSGVKGLVKDTAQLTRDVVVNPDEKAPAPQTSKQDDLPRPTVEVNAPELLHVKTLNLTGEFGGAGAVPQRSPHVLAFDAAVNNRVQPAMATAIPAHLVPGTTSNVGKDFHVAVANEADHGQDIQRQLAVNAPAMTLKT